MFQDKFVKFSELDTTLGQSWSTRFLDSSKNLVRRAPRIILHWQIERIQIHGHDLDHRAGHCSRQIDQQCESDGVVLDREYLEFPWNHHELEGLVEAQRNLQGLEIVEQ